MKKLFYVLILGVVLPAYAGKQPGVIYPISVTRVIDGDTIAFQADWLLPPLKKELSIRVYGVDTPEKGHRAKCQGEEELGEAASSFTKDIVSSAKKIEMKLMSWDKYGGRVLGDVILDGKSLREMLISKGFAREYYGEAKQSWCEE